MTVIERSCECYIQQCRKCGAVLRYSMNDIHVKDKPFRIANDVLPYITSFDGIVCPQCGEILEANRNVEVIAR